MRVLDIKGVNEYLVINFFLLVFIDDYKKVCGYSKVIRKFFLVVYISFLNEIKVYSIREMKGCFFFFIFEKDLLLLGK